MKEKNLLYTVGEALGYIIILVITAAFAFAFVFVTYYLLDIVKWIVDIFMSIGKLDAVIIVAIIGAVATFLANIFSKRSDHNFEFRKYLSEKRQESYEDFLKIFFDTLEAKGEERKDIPVRLNKFKQTLLLYGSKRTYKAFVKYWKSITDETSSSEANIDLMEKVVSEMRRDAGAGGIKNNLISNIRHL